MAGVRVPYAVIDGFLPAALHDALLAESIDQISNFTPSSVHTPDGTAYDVDVRRSWRASGAGTFSEEILRHLTAARAKLLSAVGIEPFDPWSLELERCAHLDGDYFRPHIDTYTEAQRGGMRGDRILTLVYYFHRQPRGFRGGELVLHPFGQGVENVIEPHDNRLVVFPSFARHEVRPLTVPGNVPADARFSVTGWLRRHDPTAAV